MDVFSQERYDQEHYDHDLCAYGIDGSESPWSDNPTVDGIEVGLSDYRPPICCDCQEPAAAGFICKSCGEVFHAEHLDGHGCCPECAEEPDGMWDHIDLSSGYPAKCGFLHGAILLALERLLKDDNSGAMRILSEALKRLDKEDKTKGAVESCQ